MRYLRLLLVLGFLSGCAEMEDFFMPEYYDDYLVPGESACPMAAPATSNLPAPPIQPAFQTKEPPM